MWEKEVKELRKRKCYKKHEYLNRINQINAEWRVKSWRCRRRRNSSESIRWRKSRKCSKRWRKDKKWKERCITSFDIETVEGTDERADAAGRSSNILFHHIQFRGNQTRGRRRRRWKISSIAFSLVSYLNFSKFHEFILISVILCDNFLILFYFLRRQKYCFRCE